MIPTLIFKNRSVYGKNVLYSGCPETDALFELLSPRQYLEPRELSSIAKMGFPWKIVGDIPSFNKELARMSIEDASE